MKIILTFLFSIIAIHGVCQPGPLQLNINEISDDGYILADIIVIDSTSNLTKISKLKNIDRLNLKIHYLDEIPKEFKNFVNTTSLTIRLYKTVNVDLSLLNEFPNLKYLSIDGYEGETLSNKDLKLDSLSNLQIGYCPNLHNINSIKNLKSLKELSINNVANLKELPKFSENNLIKKLKIDHMSNGRYFNEENPKNYKTDIENIKYLLHLEELTLGSLTFMNEIPDFFPPTIKKLEINAWALHHWKGDKVEIKNLNNLKLYSNLRELIFYSIHLKDFNVNFENLSLDYLFFWQIPNLTDVSGVFSFNKINYLKIINCVNLKSISGKTCKNNIENIEIDECPNIENIDFLFTCQNLNSIKLYSQSNTIKLSKSINMNKIPNISIFNSNGKIRLYKKENIWEIQTIKE